MGEGFLTHIAILGARWRCWRWPPCRGPSPPPCGKRANRQEGAGGRIQSADGQPAFPRQPGALPPLQPARAAGAVGSRRRWRSPSASISRWSSRRPTTSRARPCASCSSTCRRPGSSMAGYGAARGARRLAAGVAPSAGRADGARRRAGRRVFAAVCLLTGSLWGRPMWGTYWVWDARLTSMLLLFFLYLGHIALEPRLRRSRARRPRRRDPGAGRRRSTCRSSSSRSIGGTRCTSRPRS